MAKQYWIKRSTLPLDKNKRKMVTTTLRYKEEDKSRMIGGVFCQADKHININADSIIEGDQFEIFVKEGILEEYTEDRADQDSEALAAARGPVVAFTSAPNVAAPAIEPVSTAPKAAAPKKEEDEPKKDEKKKDEKKSDKKSKK